MPANRIHLIRHGEVHNPDGVLYGRLPNFRLSKLGNEMAESAAQELQQHGSQVKHLYVSPLLRTRESAAPVAKTFGLTPVLDDRLLEPTNVFEGRPLSGKHLLVRPHLWFHLRNPKRPSWGEPYKQISKRMLAAIEDAWQQAEDGDVAMVSHQLPIEIVKRTVTGRPWQHNPKQREVSLSSITTLERKGDRFVLVDYREPAANLAATDRGAV